MIACYLYRRASHGRGFTLIELLVAMAIFSIVSLTSFTIFNTVISSDETLKGRNERLNELNRAFLLIERDLLQLTRRTIRINGESPITGFLHLDTDGIFSDTAGIAFVRAGWTNPNLLLPRSDLQPVMYQLKENQLLRLHYNFVDAVVGAEPISRVLISDIDNVQFEFYAENKWQSELNNAELPLAVAIVIDTADFGQLRRQFLLPGYQGEQGEQGNVDD